MLGDSNLAHAPCMRAGAFAGGMAGARPSKMAMDRQLRILVAVVVFAVAAKTFTGTHGTARQRGGPPPGRRGKKGSVGAIRERLRGRR